MANPVANNVPAVEFLDGGTQFATQNVEHKKYKGVLTWNIDDFLAWSKFQDDNFIYKSQPFELHFEYSTLKFQLSLHLNTKTDDKLGFYLVNLNSEDLNIKSEFMVIDRSGAVFKIAKGCDKYTKKTGSFGITFSKKELQDRPDRLPGGALKLKCEIIVFKEANVSTSTKDDDSDSGENTSYWYEDLEKLWTGKIATDFNLRCAGELFPCHKFVLACRSHVFARMLSHKDFKENVSNEATIEDFSPETVKDFLEFLYTDELNEANLNSVELLLMADKYNVTGLKSDCEKALSKAVDTSNSIKLFCTFLDCSHVSVSVPKECACIIRNPSAKQCDWLSHARPAPFPFPLFLFP